MEIVLSIAGSDPSAGAGIQQDLKTITALGCYGATVITALTSQNTLGVQNSIAVHADVVSSQLRSVLSDLEIDAIKIGQIPNSDVAKVVAHELALYLEQHHVPIVYDPVMISTSGKRLMDAECLSTVCQLLFPLCTLITPNIPEAHTLLGNTNIDNIGTKLVQHYSTAFLIKGGHAEGSAMTDNLYCTDGTQHSFTASKITSHNLHGTGCTLSSAIAVALAKKYSLPNAVEQAKQVITRAIRNGQNLGIGHGNGPLWVTTE